MDWFQRLTEMKELRGLTMKEIAAGAELPTSTVEKLFCGVTKDPKLPTVQKIVHFLGFSLDDLASPDPLTDEPKETPVDARELLVASGVIRPNYVLNDLDERFLGSIGMAVRAWFMK